MRNIKETTTRVLILFIGLVIAHFGVTLFLLANLGTDPFNVLIQGLYKLTAGLAGTAANGALAAILTHGRVHMLVCLLIILALLIIDRSYVRIGTLVCMVFGGPIIDVFNLLLAPLFAGAVPMLIRLGANVIGCVILAFGMTIVIKSDAGTGPNDLVAIVISDKLGKKFSITRIAVDVAFAAIGASLGGTLGIGTVICAFVVGPVAGFFLPINGRIIEKMVGRG